MNFKDLVALTSGISAFNLVRDFYKRGKDHGFINGIGQLATEASAAIFAFGVVYSVMDDIDKRFTKLMEERDLPNPDVNGDAEEQADEEEKKEDKS